MADGVEVLDSGLTVDDVREIVNISNDAEGARLDSLAGEVSKLGDAVKSLSETRDASQDASDDVVYTVAISPSQVETAKGAVRVACTEGLICIVLLAAMLGLVGWHVLSGRWHA